MTLWAVGRPPYTWNTLHTYIELHTHIHTHDNVCMWFISIHMYANVYIHIWMSMWEPEFDSTCLLQLSQNLSWARSCFSKSGWPRSAASTFFHLCYLVEWSITDQILRHTHPKTYTVPNRVLVGTRQLWLCVYVGKLEFSAHFCFCFSHIFL